MTNHEWSRKWHGKWMRAHANGVVTHGSTEPVLTVLEVRGFELRDLFLMGFNEKCGRIILPSQERAQAARNALEPAYATKVKQVENGDWGVDFDRRNLDGSVGTGIIENLVMKDGTVVIKNGRWV